MFQPFYLLGFEGLDVSFLTMPVFFSDRGGLGDKKFAGTHVFKA
jgi:hypothetical protein